MHEKITEIEFDRRTFTLFVVKVLLTTRFARQTVACHSYHQPTRSCPVRAASQFAAVTFSKVISPTTLFHANVPHNRICFRLCFRIVTGRRGKINRYNSSLRFRARKSDHVLGAERTPFRPVNHFPPCRRPACFVGFSHFPAAA